jgi:protein pelota
MRILNKDIRHGEVFVEAEDLDDLWYLSQIIDVGDIAKSMTERKIKLSDKGNESTRVFKKTVIISINVDKVAFHEYTDNLRISGTVSEGMEDIPSGSHHTFNVEPGTKLTIIKERWMKYQLDRLDESSKDKGSEILICAMERDAAIFAVLTRRGYRILSEITGEVAKKADQSATVSNFYDEIIKMLTEYVERHKVKSVVLASPAFWKEDLLKLIQDKSLRGKITLATCNAVGKTAIAEILKRPEIKNVLKDERNSHEIELVDKMMEAISKNGAVAYGWAQTKGAAEMGAVASLLVTTEFISKRKQEGGFSGLNSLMMQVESANGSVHIINSSNEAGKRLDGISGLGAILRYKAQGY